MLPKPRKVGEPTILFEDTFGRALLRQNYINPKDKKGYNYTLFDYKNGTSISVVFALTKNGEVIAVNQFRHGADEYLYELPGGVPESKDEHPQDTALRELEEETGFTPETTIVLSHHPIWFDPASVTVSYWPCLGLDCIQTKKPHLDEIEYLEPVQIPITQWMEMIIANKITDSKTIVTSFLAYHYIHSLNIKT